jgi:hypothetical protein
MFQLKPINENAIPKALEKAERYRLLGEPYEAESICLDILSIEPDNQQALMTLLLALTDQFPSRLADCFSRAQAVVRRLQGEYEKSYYTGIICERRGNAHLDRGDPGSGAVAFEWLHQAMVRYEEAEACRPADNDDAILRWNTCARTLMKHHLQAPVPGSFEPILQE